MARQHERSTFATVDEALELLTVDQLKPLVALLPTDKRPTRKGELTALISQCLSGEALRALYEQLDELQRLAVAETLYAAGGVFDADRFRAKYGALPIFGTQKTTWGYGETPSLLRVFLYQMQRYGGGTYVLPEDVQPRLRRFVSRPPETTLNTTDEIPESYALSEKTYELQEGDTGLLVIARKAAYRVPRQPPKVTVTTHHIPLTRRDTERTAQQGVHTVLRLIDRGKIAVSDKTFQASSATLAELAPLLRDGDLYALTPKQSKWEQDIGPMQAFAWPLLVQAGRLAELHGKKLALTRAGRQALGTPAADTLRLLWQRWLKTKLLDEFRRIDVIKGQSAKSGRAMTAAEGRRRVIVEALQQCPVGRWVQVDDFCRFMQATGHDFEVTRAPWELYIAEPQNGSLGYDGSHGWPILQGRYVLCFLFEYAATLGVIDVAYIPPTGVRGDYRQMWGTDDLAFLSRYDGLLYFRLNPLGAYCLGVAESYRPDFRQAHTALTVLPSLHVHITGAALSPEEALLLETYAEQEADTVWCLDRNKAFAAVESGQQIAELREFLQARDAQPLPETVESFILTTERRARALVNKGMRLLIECADGEIAESIARDEHTKKFCWRAGERHLVVQTEAEESFRKALHLLGYGMPRL